MGYIEALVQENEELRDRVHNLNLYLDYLRETVISPDDWQKFEERFYGLAGYGNDSTWSEK